MGLGWGVGNRLHLHKWETGEIHFSFIGVYLEVGYNTRKEQGREMFGGGVGGKLTNCLPVIFLLSAFLIQTMAR